MNNPYNVGLSIFHRHYFPKNQNNPPNLPISSISTALAPKIYRKFIESQITSILARTSDPATGDGWSSRRSSSLVLLGGKSATWGSDGVQGLLTVQCSRVPTPPRLQLRFSSWVLSFLFCFNWFLFFVG